MAFTGHPVPLPPPHQLDIPVWRQRLTAKNAALEAGPFADDVRRIVYEFALTRNAWGSTNIDAAPIAKGRVAALRDAHRHDATHHLTVAPTETEVLRYFDLLSDLPHRRFRLSIDDIRDVHRAYFRGVPLQNDARAGAFKTSPIVITGPGKLVSDTSGPDEVEPHLDQLVSWWNGLADPGPEHVAQFFHAFQAIHPFADGNGRAGRVLAVQLLSSIGLEAIRYCPIDDTLNRQREAYFRALLEADLGRPVDWLLLFFTAIDDGYSRAARLGQRLQAIPTDVDPRARDTIAWACIRGDPSFSPSDIAHLWQDVSERTRLRHLNRLVALGQLTVAGTTRGRTYRLAFRVPEAGASDAERREWNVPSSKAGGMQRSVFWRQLI